MSNSITDALLRRVEEGDQQARDDLLQLYRDRLHRMVDLRLNRRVAKRVAPSDVVQETMIDASAKLPDYLEHRPVAFYPWLRKIAWEKLIQAHRRHLDVAKRSVRREEPQMALTDESIHELASVFATSQTSVHQAMVRGEMLDRVHRTLEQLKPMDREVLVMRYLEQLSTGEIAETLDISLAAVKMRHARALQRLQQILGGGN